MTSPRSIALHIRKRLQVSTIDSPPVHLSRDAWQLILAALDRQGQQAQLAARHGELMNALPPFEAAFSGDSGTVTISTGHLKDVDWWRLAKAAKAIRAGQAAPNVSRGS